MLPFSDKVLSPRISSHRLIAGFAIAFTLFFNHSYFHNLYNLYGATLHGWAFMAALALLLLFFNILLLSLVCFRFTTKGVLTILLIGGAAASYYMDRFNIVIDSTMLTNVLQTDAREIRDLLSFTLLSELLVLGVLPTWWLWRVRIDYGRWTRELRNRLLLVGGSLLLVLLSAIPFTADYASYLREHKLLRYYANPVTFVYSGGLLASNALATVDTGPRQPIGVNAHIPATDKQRELVILVVGEAARADHFSLNGYHRNTNPLLAQENVIFFSDVTSCGTATAYSVPCMFSPLDRANFSIKAAGNSENLLDVLRHAGVSVLWRDNNSDSKGVARNIEFQNYQSSATNTMCDVECRDVGMLVGLDQWITAHPTGDLTIVLHQMGNHGPAYYKRYPPEFGKFQPVCTSNQLEQCSQEQIVNSYDNALLYTDYFLAQTIAFLKSHDDNFETALYYMSDHGESLGENGLYLHGLPYLLAPATQTHVASLLWFGRNYAIDRDKLRQRAGNSWSHDDYFHTVLSLMEIETAEYDPHKDWLAGTHLPE